MKTERVTLLTSPDFKAFLNAEAHREGVSVAELVRTRCERRPSDEEVMLAELTRELQRSMGVAKRSLKSGLDEAQAVLKELSLHRAGAAAVAPTVAPTMTPKARSASASAELITVPQVKAKASPKAVAKVTAKGIAVKAPKRELAVAGADSGVGGKARKGARA
jgi:hypothetical protein